MYTSNPIFAIIVFVIAIVTSKLINLKFKLDVGNNRNLSIDGLRGFLAIGVFINHSSVWYQYLHYNDWLHSKTNFYNQLGSACVALFFMITSFLFISKLLNTKTEFNWRNFFISRIFRLSPAYYFSFALILVVIFLLDRQLNVGIVKFIASLVHWIFFTTFNNPYINHNQYTKIINAGVLWSLRYEWLFYFVLPIISIPILKKLPPLKILFVSLVFILVFLKYRSIDYNHILSFVGGAIAPFIIKYKKDLSIFESKIVSIIIIACFFGVPFFFTSDIIYCKILLTIAFTLIALGNTIFGILKRHSLILLGEFCYSTYLLHGIMLFIYFHLIVGKNNAIHFTEIQYWTYIFILAPFVVIMSFLSYIFFEKPGMDFSKKLIKRLK